MVGLQTKICLELPGVATNECQAVIGLMLATATPLLAKSNVTPFPPSTRAESTRRGTLAIPSILYRVSRKLPTRTVAPRYNVRANFLPRTEQFPFISRSSRVRISLTPFRLRIPYRRVYIFEKNSASPSAPPVSAVRPFFIRGRRCARRELFFGIVLRERNLKRSAVSKGWNERKRTGRRERRRERDS